MSHARILSALTATAALLGVGFVDYATGRDIRVIALYFLPLAYAGYHLSYRGAIAASFLGDVVWSFVFYGEATHDRHLVVYAIDFLLQGAAFLAISCLVARLAELLAREKAASRTDALTRLDSRVAFVEKAGVALSLCQRHARPVTVAFIDLDRFKQVNDREGHARGDQLLRTCGQVLRGSLRASDIAARHGGDEFVVLLPETGVADGQLFCEQLRHALDRQQEFLSSGVTASIGVVVDERAHHTLDHLVEEADEQMYESKRAGLHRCHVRVLEMPTPRTLHEEEAR